jgi:RNA polymerase sigma-70 factor, ECF subfamily
VTGIQAVDLFEQERGRLLTLAYGFLGSRADAADAVQDAWIRWQNRPTGEVRDPAGWLTTVTARLSLDRLRSARAHRETYPGTWLPEPIVEEPSPEQSILQRSELSMAFLFLMERLGPEERAAFVLREVFDRSYRDIAEVLDRTEAACRQLVTRARERVRLENVRHEVDRLAVERVLDKYLQALAAGDERELLQLIAPDAVLYGDGGGKVPSVINPIYGHDRITRFLIGLQRKFPGQYTMRAVNINRQPGLLIYRGGVLSGVSAYQIAEGRIQGIYHVLNPDKLGRHGTADFSL